jgi:hypothetical protein
MSKFHKIAPIFGAIMLSGCAALKEPSEPVYLVFNHNASDSAADTCIINAVNHEAGKAHEEGVLGFGYMINDLRSECEMKTGTRAKNMKKIRGVSFMF